MGVVWRAGSAKLLEEVVEHDVPGVGLVMVGGVTSVQQHHGLAVGEDGQVPY